MITTNFKYPTVEIFSDSEVFKSEDGENYSFLFSGGDYSDTNLCIPLLPEEINYYFYSGQGQIYTVEVKNSSLKV